MRYFCLIVAVMMVFYTPLFGFIQYDMSPGYEVIDDYNIGSLNGRLSVSIQPQIEGVLSLGCLSGDSSALSTQTLRHSEWLSVYLLAGGRYRHSITPTIEGYGLLLGGWGTQLYSHHNGFMGITSVGVQAMMGSLFGVFLEGGWRFSMASSLSSVQESYSIKCGVLFRLYTDMLEPLYLDNDKRFQGRELKRKTIIRSGKGKQIYDY